jgi:hypothetical protein
MLSNTNLISEAQMSQESKQIVDAHAKKMYIYEIAEKSPQQHDNECSHNHMGVAHRMSDHHEWQ